MTEMEAWQMLNAAEAQIAELAGDARRAWEIGDALMRLEEAGVRDVLWPFETPESLWRSMPVPLSVSLLAECFEVRRRASVRPSAP